MPSNLHRKYCGQRHCGHSHQRQSSRLLFHSLLPHQRNNYQRERVTPPTHLQDSGGQNAVLSAEVYVSVFFPFLRIDAKNFYVAVIGFS